MTLFLKLRPPVYEARLYDPSRAESSASSLTSWILSSMANAQVTVTADATSFSITGQGGDEASFSASGVPGDWIVIGAGTAPEIITGGQLQDRFEIST